MSISIKDKVIAITGGSSGIGAATAVALARRGAKLVLGARRMDRLAAVAAEITRHGGAAEIQACDVTQREQVCRLLQRAVEKFGRLDVAIANAGFGVFASVQDTTEAQMEEIWRVNVLGTWYVMAQAADIMVKQKAGHIIITSSAVARRGLPYMGPYCMTKAAQLSLAEAQRVELSGTGVYVSSVHPISTRTDFFTEASRRSNRRIGGLGKMQAVELVAKKIVHLIERPRPELWPHSASRWGLGFSSLLPGLADHIMRRLARPRTGGKEQHVRT